jgi:hypothetical protein
MVVDAGADSGEGRERKTSASARQRRPGLPRRLLRGVVMALLVLGGSAAGLAEASAPIRLHPGNPRYFEWRGRAIALVTSAEHYGAELNESDNLSYEIQNEPWADNHVMGDVINPYLTDRHTFPNAVEITTADSIAWQAAIARIIAEEESRLPRRHLIAQNIANFRLPIRASDLAPGVSIVNFHYAYPEAAAWNPGLSTVVGYDETGFAGRDDATYRRQAWNFLLSGGGLFNSLDYSFTVGREDGTDTAKRASGGGGPALRRQLKVLGGFLHSFDLAELRPDNDFVKESPGVVVRVLSAPGRAYALYMEGRSPTQLGVELPRGPWHAEWIDPVDGTVLQQENLKHAGGPGHLSSPSFVESVALRVSRISDGSCFHAGERT